MKANGEYMTGVLTAGQDGDAAGRVHRHGDLTYVSYAGQRRPEGLEQAAYLHRTAAAAVPPNVLAIAAPVREVSVRRALLLSVAIPGAGHLYLGRRRAAARLIGLLLLHVLLIVATADGAVGVLFSVAGWLLLSLAATVWAAPIARRMRQEWLTLSASQR